jgi:hypothetical protein
VFHKFILIQDFEFDFLVHNAVLSGKLQLAKISEARTKSQL